jgi:hypothetical protein
LRSRSAVAECACGVRLRCWLAVPGTNPACDSAGHQVSQQSSKASWEHLAAALRACLRPSLKGAGGPLRPFPHEWQWRKCKQSRRETFPSGNQERDEGGRWRIKAEVVGTTAAEGSTSTVKCRGKYERSARPHNGAVEGPYMKTQGALSNLSARPAARTQQHFVTAVARKRACTAINECLAKHWKSINNKPRDDHA